MKLYRNKQRNFNLFAICSILMLFNFSCDRIIDLEIPEKPPKLVVGGFFNTDSTMAIRVSRTEHVILRGVRERRYFEVNNAHVELHQNGNFVEVLKHHTYLYLGDIFTDSSVYTTNNFIASEGNRYTISISAPGFEPVEASTNMPSKIPLTDFEVGEVRIPLSIGMEGLPAKISFQDAPDEENFYALEVMAEWNHDDETFKQGLGIASLLEEKIDFRKQKPIIHFELYFSDASFDGQLHTYEFALLWHPDPESTLRYTAFLKHINKTHFEYATTARLQEAETRDNPFSLPVQVQTNVKNGLGIFSGYNASVKTIKVTN